MMMFFLCLTRMKVLSFCLTLKISARRIFSVSDVTSTKFSQQSFGCYLNKVSDVISTKFRMLSQQSKCVVCFSSFIFVTEVKMSKDIWIHPFNLKSIIKLINFSFICSSVSVEMLGRFREGGIIWKRTNPTSFCSTFQVSNFWISLLIFFFAGGASFSCIKGIEIGMNT